MQQKILTRSLGVALAALLAVALPASTVEPGENDAGSPLVDLLQSDGMTREELADLYQALAAGGFEPPPCEPGEEMFDDVPASNLFCSWIEELARRGVTGGCDADNYCPGDPLSRAQMAIFVVRAIEAATPMWAVVSADGNSIPAQSGGISAQRLDGPGLVGYFVKFPQPVQGKAIVAMPLSAGPLGTPTGDIGVKVKPCGDGPVPGGSDCSLGDNTPRDVFVFTHDDGSFVEAGFYIVVHP